VELLVQYDNLVNLTNLIKKINSIFEVILHFCITIMFLQVYTFFMCGTNIPVAIFSIQNLVRMQQIIPRLISLSDILSCMFELFALTMPSAKIQTELKAIEENVFPNKQIWIPHNEDNYQIALAIVEQSRQADSQYIRITIHLILRSHEKKFSLSSKINCLPSFRVELKEKKKFFSCERSIGCIVIGCIVIRMYLLSASRQDLGISLWGFATMSKSMILTVRYV
jgi:hypothetical protein